MKIAQIVASIEDEASGPSYTVPSLAYSLARKSHQVELHSLGSSSVECRDAVRFVGHQVDFQRVPLLKRLGMSRRMKQSLLVSDADVFHTHGLWMMPNIYPAAAARRSNRPLLLAPRGMLGKNALKFSTTRKSFFWHLAQKHAVNEVSCFHATAASEYEDIRAFGLTQPVAIIPNGIDLPPLDGLVDKQASFSLHVPYVLSLGRIHPKKALDRLISAWSKLDESYSHWQLRLVGPDEVGYSNELKRQICGLGLEGKVSIEPPVFGREKEALMRGADLFALSTLHENFAMTVAESLAVETPVISTKGAPWCGLQKKGCGWWIDHGADAMAATLAQALSLSQEQRIAMGRSGRKWMQEDFGWDGIATKMSSVYRWLRNRENVPDYVRLD